MSAELAVGVESFQEGDIDVLAIPILEAFKAQTETHAGPEHREKQLESISMMVKDAVAAFGSDLPKLSEMRSPSSTTYKPPSPEVIEMLKKVHDWRECDMFKLEKASNGRPLAAVVQTVLKDLGLISYFSIDIDKLEVFLTELEKQYKHNHYHNSTHAADVVQAVYVMMTMDGLNLKLQPWEQLGLVLAAAGHDVGHPGLTNKFLCDTHHSSAITHGYSSPNERTHAALTISLLREHKVISHVPEFELIRSLIHDVVLPTDMQKHKDEIADFQHEVEVSGADLALWTLQAQRTKAMAMFLHMADISNVGRPRAQAVKWGALVLEEAHEQGDLERARSMPVCALNDRTNPDLPGSQSLFITFFRVRDAFVALSAMAPTFGALVLSFLDDNLAYYESLVKRGVKTVPDLDL